MMGLTNLTQCDSVQRDCPQSDQVLKKKDWGRVKVGTWVGIKQIFVIIIFSFFLLYHGLHLGLGLRFSSQQAIYLSFYQDVGPPATVAW